MGKMLENPRYRVMSFRVTDAEYKLIMEAKPGGCTGSFLRVLALDGLASRLSPVPPASPLPSPAGPANGHNRGPA